MDNLVSTESKHQIIFKDHINANQLLNLAESIPSSIKCISLDCFDTILWRKSATPIDVFFDLQHKPIFKSLGLTPSLRVQGEKKARRLNRINKGSNEVTLNEIYQAILPKLPINDINKLIEEEIACEFDLCYAFPPIVDFIRKTHALGLKIIIASDTYLNESKLKSLLKHCLPHDVFSMISLFFCSCEHGYSKSNGLFRIILDQLNIHPNSILHLGDHLQADFHSPKKHNIHAIHFMQYDSYIDELHRMQTLAGTFMDSSIRSSRSLSSPYKAITAAWSNSPDRPESLIGYISLGPIIHAFSRFIIDEIETLRTQGKNTKVLFLLRDAFLPFLGCEALTEGKVGSLVNISRFTSIAASFRSEEDINDYLNENVSSHRFKDICKQLLLPEHIANSICIDLDHVSNPEVCFIKSINETRILQQVLTSSALLCDRLIKHIQSKITLEKNDTLIFVDLGYSGTSQLKLAPILQKKLDIEVIGRYLISLVTPHWQHNKKGLLDASWCDERTLHSLVTYISQLEQLCTTNQSSVVDYDLQGEPVFANSTLSTFQHDKLQLIQSECIKFIKDAEKFFKINNIKMPIHTLRDAVLCELTRMLFLPTSQELAYLKTFQFELNLGTKDLLELFDPEKGLNGLRRRGLFFMEKNLKSMRTNYPAELRSAGLELSLTLMAQHRINFDMHINDFSLRRENINIIIVRGNETSTSVLTALPTYDGYFSLIVPTGSNNIQIGLQFGLLYRWIQLISAEFIKISALYTSKESQHTVDASDCLVSSHMIDQGGGLYECTSDNSLLIFAPKTVINTSQQCLRLIFRPIVPRPSTA